MTAAGNRVWNEVVNIHLRRIAELEQELAKADAMLREYMLLGTVENFADAKAALARVEDLCKKRDANGPHVEHPPGRSWLTTGMVRIALAGPGEGR